MGLFTIVPPLQEGVPSEVMHAYSGSTRTRTQDWEWACDPPSAGVFSSTVSHVPALPARSATPAVARTTFTPAGPGKVTFRVTAIPAGVPMFQDVDLDVLPAGAPGPAASPPPPTTPRDWFAPLRTAVAAIAGLGGSVVSGIATLIVFPVRVIDAMIADPEKVVVALATVVGLIMVGGFYRMIWVDMDIASSVKPAPPVVYYDRTDVRNTLPPIPAPVIHPAPTVPSPAPTHP